MTSRLEPATRRHFAWEGVRLSLYAPWWATSRRKLELGFALKIRDPRAPCEHWRTSWHGPEATGDIWRPRCARCGAWLEVRHDRGVHPRGRWRHVKVYVARTRPARRDRLRGVVMCEAQTYLSDGMLGKLTTKVFVRLKLGLGGPHS